MTRIWLFFSVTLFFCAACVSNKKFTYLQKEDINKKSLPKDTVLRKYEIDQYDYKVQSQDILSVRFESLTPKEYDFLASEGTQNMNIMGGNALVIGELVDERGEIPLPVIGKIKVAGLNVFQVQDTLQIIANQYMESPIVKVRLLNFRITILGEVNKEGTITLTNNRVTLVEAIGLAGGLTDISDKANVKIIRQKGGTAEVFYVDLLKEEFVTSPYYYIHQNDVIIVPPLAQRPYRRYLGQNLGLVISTISLLLLVFNLTK